MSRADCEKRISDINERIRSGDVVVMTAEEFKRSVREGASEDELREVDIVTTATCGLMSGTAAIFSLEIAERGAFERAESAWLNGVPAFPGPCPNERLGVIDVIVFGTSHIASYGGGHLFRDIVSGKSVDVEVRAIDGRMFRRTVTIDDLMFARLFTTRSAFRNYMAFVNTNESTVRSIFSVSGLRGPLKEASVCGCGEINPLENDPDMRIMRMGTRILVNGADGFVLGEGTRSTPERRNIAVIAEMKHMKPEFMGGFVTSAGPECITSIAVPIPVVDDLMLKRLSVLDEDVRMPIAEIQRRTQIAESNYGCVWQRTSHEIQFDAARCLHHEVCAVEERCPVKAFTRDAGIDRERCFNCGFCVNVCDGGAFTGDLGAIEVHGKRIPITLRLSSREKARKLCTLLKDMIERGEFMLSV